jgi:hypothetical protein
MFEQRLKCVIPCDNATHQAFTKKKYAIHQALTICLICGINSYNEMIIPIKGVNLILVFSFWPKSETGTGVPRFLVLKNWNWNRDFD